LERLRPSAYSVACAKGKNDSYWQWMSVTREQAMDLLYEMEKGLDKKKKNKKAVS
jgi:hypothetical protein